ncbi:MAG: response regulator, partial [Rhodospirillaceae bacterium]
MAEILVIDDEASIRTGLETFLAIRGHHASLAASLAQGQALAKVITFDAVLLDVFLQEEDGLDWFSLVGTRPVPVLVLSGQADLATAVKAIQKGAFDFLEKPLDPIRLSQTLDRALEHGRLVGQVQKLREELVQKRFVVGESPRMAELMHLLGRVAPSPLSLLIT